MSDACGAVRITGTTEAADIAIVLAALAARERTPDPGRRSSYEQWRRTRLAALRAEPPR